MLTSSWELGDGAAVFELFFGTARTRLSVSPGSPVPQDADHDLQGFTSFDASRQPASLLFGGGQSVKRPQSSLPEPEAELTAVETFFGMSRPCAVRSSISSESPMTQIVARRDGFKSESRSAEGSTEPNSELHTDSSVLRSARDGRLLVQWLDRAR